MSVLVETPLGDLEVDLYVDEAPKECLNFLKLCKIKYYNWCLIHRVLKNYMLQTGDPTAAADPTTSTGARTGVGVGGVSIWGHTEGHQSRYFLKNPKNRIKHKHFGQLSLVAANDLHGSQFLITLREDVDHLDGTHAVFGEVAEDSHDVSSITFYLDTSAIFPPFKLGAPRPAGRRPVKSMMYFVAGAAAHTYIANFFFSFSNNLGV